MRIFVLCCLSLSSLPVAAHPLLPPQRLRAATKIPLPAALKKRLNQFLKKTSWKLTGYHLWDQEAGEYLEVAKRRDHIDETVETWMLRPDGTFRHIMSKDLWFTGKWEIVEGISVGPKGGVVAAPEHPYFVLHTTRVRGSIPTLKRKHDWFVGTWLDGRRGLILYYVGQRWERSHRNSLKQAHRFEAVRYGER